MCFFDNKIDTKARKSESRKQLHGKFTLFTFSIRLTSFLKYKGLFIWSFLCNKLKDKYPNAHSVEFNFSYLDRKTHSDIPKPFPKIILFNQTSSVFQILQKNYSRRGIFDDTFTKLTPQYISFSLKVTKLAQEVYCLDKPDIILAPGIYAWIDNAPEKIYSPYQDLTERWSGNSIVARFKTPELTYDELVNMGQKPKLILLPGSRKAQVVEEFYRKYWNLMNNEIFERLKRYVNEVLYNHHGFIFTGHGGGAVLATFAAIIFQSRWPKRQFYLATYGAPRIGNYFFANNIVSLFQNLRFTVGNDYVPLFFGHKYLSHLPLEVWIPSNNGCDCFAPDDVEIPEIHLCIKPPFGFENKDCNLKFEKQPGQLPERATTAHVGPYFGFLMSPQGCSD
ncbi:hypothetical protein G9A89_007716 [Geosiphon pyriformis]|nr:hypothetical protein G9A89_007716 [Geosiphon pyriformis]